MWLRTSPRQWARSRAENSAGSFRELTTRWRAQGKGPRHTRLMVGRGRVG
jgi:hypothetical protein